MTRSKRFVNGAVLGYIYQILVVVVGLWLTPFLLNRIGQHNYGVWLIGLQALAYLAMADIGVVALLPREIAYATGRSGCGAASTELPTIIGRTVRLVLYQTPLVAAIAVVVWLLFHPGASDARGFLGLILVIYTFLFPFRIFRAAVEGLQDLQFMGRTTIFAWIVGTVTTVGLVLAGFGLYALAIGWGAMQVFSAACFAFRLWTKYPHALPSRRSDFSAAGAGGYVKRGLWANLTQIAMPLMNGADVLIMGKILGPIAVVPYSCTGKMVGVLANQPQMLLELATPGLSEIKASASKPQILRVTSALTQVSLMVSGALAFVVVVANQGFVGWWVGPGQYGGATLTLLIALTMLLRHWNSTAVYSMFCYGLERRLAITCLLDGLVTFAVSVGMIQWLGPIGGPLGSMFGVCMISLPANLLSIAHEADVSLTGLLRPLWPWAWRFAALVAAAFAIVRLWAPQGFLLTALTGGLAGLVYLIVMVRVTRNSVLWEYLQPRLASIYELYGNAFGHRKPVAHSGESNSKGTAELVSPATDVNS